jgi:ribosome-associated protein
VDDSLVRFPRSREAAAVSPGVGVGVGVGEDGAVRDVPITTATIRLGQLLKLAGLVDSGSDAKVVLGDGEVLVNGEVEQRRGRQLRPGDEVELAGESVRLVEGT